MFPDIEGLDEIKLISLVDIDRDKLNSIINNNKEVYFLTESDYLATSNITNQIKKSQMKVGETLVPNPERASLETEINNLDKKEYLHIVNLK